MSSFDTKLRAVATRLEELRDTLASGSLSPDEMLAFGKEYATLEPVANKINELEGLRAEIGDL